jgi:hypothetical protein
MYANLFISDGRPERVGTPANPSISQAASMGPATLSVNTGSGIVPLALASGISQFINIAFQTLPDDTDGKAIEWSTVGNQFPDNFYNINTGDEFITILVPGFYLATYRVSLVKSDGNERATVGTSVTLNGLTVLGSTSSAYLRNTVDNNNTANGTCMFNAEPGTQVAIRAAKQTNLSDGIDIPSRECTLVLQYISPPRGGISAL